MLHTHENKARESSGILEEVRGGNPQEGNLSIEMQGRPRISPQLGLLVYINLVQDRKNKRKAQDAHRELPTSFINTLKSLVPANVPFASIDVVNSRAPIVCLRLRATRFWYRDDVLEDKVRSAVSDIILVSKVMARLRAEE